MEILMKNSYKKYFLGANSCEGFLSKFGECYDPSDGWRVYIIKGGPGTGKSSFMKYMVSRADAHGYSVDLCPCSSDPHSLDAVLIPEIKTVFLDGTAPHVVEPKLPGACEEIINLGTFWDSDRLKTLSHDILVDSAKNSACHKAASGYLAAAGKLMHENLRLSTDCTDTEHLLGYAHNLAKRKIPKKHKGTAREWVRFLGGVTPLGVVAYPSTLTESCEQRIIISDKYGSVSNLILETVRSYALDAGYEIITFKNPFLPSLLCDHLMIPELSLCFATENDLISFDCDERRINSRRFTDAVKLRSVRQRMRFCKNTAYELILSASQRLHDAKLCHDTLEKHYISSMDFSALSLFAEELADKIFT